MSLVSHLSVRLERGVLVSVGDRGRIDVELSLVFHLHEENDCEDGEANDS